MLRGFNPLDLLFNDTSNESAFAFKPPILGISVGVLATLSVLGNSFVLIAFALRGKWNNKTKFDVSMVCSSLVIAVFFLPVCAYKLLGTPSPNTSHVVCAVIDALQGYCVLNHLLTACVTSVWNFVSVKYPLQTLAWFQPWRTNVLVASPWIFVLVYVIAYISVVVTMFDMGYGCVQAIREIPTWIHLTTVYGLIIPSVVIILVVNGSFLSLARRHIRTLNAQEQRASNLHSVDSSPVVKRRFDRKSPVGCELLQRRFKRGRRLSLFLFLCIIVWLPTVATACIVAICFDCIDTMTLIFISGISHSISSITPPIFYLLNTEHRTFLRKQYRTIKIKLCQGSEFDAVPANV